MRLEWKLIELLRLGAGGGMTGRITFILHAYAMLRFATVLI